MSHEENPLLNSFVSVLGGRICDTCGKWRYDTSYDTDEGTTCRLCSGAQPKVLPDPVKEARKKVAADRKGAASQARIESLEKRIAHLEEELHKEKNK